jgi:transposase-like protein
MIVVAWGGDQPEPEPHKMKAKRRRHEPEFKARVALEALKGIKTIQQIAKDFDVHPVQVSDWKKAMTEGATGIFGRGLEKADAEDFERQRDELHAKIGQLTVEVDFLRKKSKQLGL